MATNKMSLAVLITVYNRRDNTLKCLDSMAEGLGKSNNFFISVFLTDDGSTDGTAEYIKERHYPFAINILKGNGNLYWNGGMINSWKAAIDSGEEFNGFLWLNNDTEILPGFWNELQEADKYCRSKYGKGGIYIGSTYGRNNDNPNHYGNGNERKLSYGGFNFVSKITLKDEFVVPNGSFQECQCAHGNLTYISNDVVKKMGIFTDKYIHGGSDHDYTYRAYKKGFHLIVLPSFVGVCENDHPKDAYKSISKMTLKERIAAMKSPVGFNMHNTLVFQRRCFPFRYPFVWLACWFRILFPRLYWKIYQWLRK